MTKTKTKTKQHKPQKLIWSKKKKKNPVQACWVLYISGDKTHLKGIKRRETAQGLKKKPPWTSLYHHPIIQLNSLSMKRACVCVCVILTGFCVDYTAGKEMTSRDTLDFALAGLQMALRCGASLQNNSSNRREEMQECRHVVFALQMFALCPRQSVFKQLAGCVTVSGCFLRPVRLCSSAGMEFSFGKWIPNEIRQVSKNHRSGCWTSALWMTNSLDPKLRKHTNSGKHNGNKIMADRKTYNKRNYFVHSMVHGCPKPIKTPLSSVGSPL